MMKQILPDKTVNHISHSERYVISEFISRLACLFSLGMNQTYGRWHSHFKNSIRYACHVPLGIAYWSIRQNQLEAVLTWLGEMEKEALSTCGETIKNTLNQGELK